MSKELTAATDIEQCIGYHSSGLRIVERKTVITDLSDDADKPYDEMDEDERAWWDSLLHNLHLVRLAIEGLPPEERRLVEANLAGLDYCDLEDLPGHMESLASEAIGRKLLP